MFRKTTIFAAARKAHGDYGLQDPQRYHKAQYTWSLALESHPAMGIHKLEFLDLGSDWDDEAGYHRVSARAPNDGAIIGRISLAEGSRLSPDQFEQVLRQRLNSKNDNLDADSESEDWLRHALHELQEEKILDKFDCDAFLTFAHGYLANRQAEGSDTPATVVYPALHPHKEKHKSGFWISHTPAKGNSEGMYGGLM